MKLKIVLATGTALALLMATGAASAGDTAVLVQANDSNAGLIDQSAGDLNTAKLVQDGDENTATITQEGNSNRAGAHLPSGWDDPYDTARGYNFMRQAGDNNSLTIQQDVGRNIIAIDGSFQQNGNHNEATITQHGGVSGGARVNSVTQTDTTGTATATTNELTILQEAGAPDYSDGVHYAYEYIDSVKQTNTGGAANELTLTQTGGSYVSPPNNHIYQVVQSGTGNIGMVTQTGRSNKVILLSQAGAANQSTVTLTGVGNGTVNFDPWSAAGAAAGDNPLIQGVLGYFGVTYAGVEQATVLQNGTGNFETYTATGDGNSYGFNQDGDGNYINGLSTGDDNAVAVVQFHDDNIADFLQDGNDNDIGIFQQGHHNQATANLTGNGNHAALGQYGNDNVGTVTFDGADNIGVLLQALGDNNQAHLSATGNDNILVSIQGGGDGNVANVTATGSNNIAGAIQAIGGDNHSDITIGDTATSSNNFAVTLQVGSSNHATVGINGSGNNMPLLATFDGDALIAAGSSLATIDSVVGVSVPIIGGYSLLQPGLMTQVGAGNELNMTVSGDTNLFASLQDGNNNDVVHTVTGSSNQVAVLQDGNNNHSSTAQYGVGNNAGIIQ